MRYPLTPVPFSDVRSTSGFWRTRHDVNLRVTLPALLEQCERSGRLANFGLAADVLRRRAAGETSFQIQPPTQYPFDDTDIYKVIEGASYSLVTHPDAGLSRRLDDWIARIAAAQEPDGYLFTFRTMHPDTPGHEWVGRERWDADPELSHELYNAGHLYEAGVAHFEATGRRELFDVCLRNAELLWRDFGEGRRRLAPGHPIVEMGLVKLFRATNDERWLALAQNFLDARGPTGPEIHQRHALVVDQKEAVGHAVRANYLYAGMVDVGVLAGHRGYRTAVDRIWTNVVQKKLELTAGVGAREQGEAYGANYELASGGYNETCAAISLMMWAQRMFLATGEASYVDVLERAAYNAFCSGVSLAGDHFFYTNPVAYDGVGKNNHGHAGRAPWFGCACCPPNVLRTLATFSGYFYAVGKGALYVNLYGASQGVARLGETSVRLVQSTGYPWSGHVRLELLPERPARFTLRLRIPGWARGEPVPSDLYRYEQAPATEFRVLLNGTVVAASLRGGYCELDREWREGDLVELDFPLGVRRVRAHERVTAAAGRVALERGPVVYCVEELDAQAPLAELAAPADARVTADTRADLPSDLPVLRVEPRHSQAFEAVPYFAWNNRGLCPMTVWLAAGEAGAR
jgi:DUF1680 family protein